MLQREFICLKCGRCCTGLVSEDRGLLRGLTLLPDERQLFDGAVLKPAVGIGRRPHEKGFKVVAYQMIEETCPHLEDPGCAVYPERPVSCRQFPFSLSLGTEGELLMGLDLNCPSLSKALDEGFKPTQNFNGRKHAELFLAILRETLSQPAKTWYYDLETNSWVSHRELKAEEAVNTSKDSYY
jgi:Fe-S-cluster containining protein